MATYASKDNKYGAEAKTAAEWQKYFHDTMSMGYKPAAELWRNELAAGEFVIATGKARKPRVAKGEKKAGKVTKSEAAAKRVEKAKIKENKAFKPVEYKVSDPDDPHHYEFVREYFTKESDRDSKIAEIKKNSKLTFISKGFGDRKYCVSYWKQVD